ncbi:MAG: galactose-1-phosphate uridylyltransferase [Actinomycetota bacterium]|nr:galactose-1-phosphate uridylyltransferase [Actinomycetota bacterium]
MPHSVRRTAARLADGREIIYFDDTEPFLSGVETRELTDKRELAPAAKAGQMRRDPLSGAWIAMATHRLDRTYLPPADECPLCPTGRGTEPSEVPADDYDVVVFENRFPSYSVRNGDGSAGSAGADGIWAHAPATGRCEVVCFTSDHNATFADLDPGRVRTVIEAWADRTTDLNRMNEVAQVFPFENRGKEIGVTLQHPHGQIYGYPLVTPRTGTMLARAAEHRERTGGSLLRDILEAERADGQRIVFEGRHWTAYVPYAARWPVEVHLAPNRDVPDLPALDDEERDELSHVYLDLLQRLDRYYLAADGGPVRLPYIAGWHQAPAREGRDLARLHLQVTSVLRAPGKLKYLAGSESGMGAWVNDTTPERIAARLRAVAAE